MSRITTVSISMTEGDLVSLDALAEGENRNRSNMVVELIRRAGQTQSSGRPLAHTAGDPSNGK